MRAALAFCVGVALGLLPMLPYATDLTAFWFNNFGYHEANAEWRALTGYPGPMSLPAKIFYALAVLRQPHNLIVFIGIAFGLISHFGGLRAGTKTFMRSGAGAALAVLLFVIALPVAIAPTPSFVPYYAMPVSFLFLILINACVAPSPRVTALNTRGLCVLMIGTLVYSGPGLLKKVISLSHRQAWAGLQAHDVAMEIRNTIRAGDDEAIQRLATLSPALAVEANLSLYPQFSTGPFLYRVGDLLTSWQRTHFVGTSPETVAELLNADPPMAILVGFEKELDAPFIDYAQANKYTLATVRGLDGQLYIRPTAAVPSISSPKAVGRQE